MKPAPQNQLPATIVASTSLPLVQNAAPGFLTLEPCSVLVICKPNLTGPMTSPCTSSIALATSRTLKESTIP
jgi:hypothetical protein